MASELLNTPTSPFFERVRIGGNPIAHAQSMVVAGNARFTLLTARLIRMEWSPSATFEDRATFAFPNRAAEPPTFTHEREDGVLTISTEALTVRYQNDGQLFNADNLSIQHAGGEWKPGTPNTGNLRGTYRTLDQSADAAALPEGLLSRDGWSLIDDSGLPVWDVDGGWVEARHDDHVQDWYFFGYGHDYKAALSEYIRFGGSIPLVPRYVLGGWWSRYWDYSDQDLKDLVNDFRAHDVPLDVLVIDMGWHTPDAWTGYTWNRELFPDPEAFLAWVHEQGLYATLNLHPAQGVQKHEEIYPHLAGLLGHDTTDGAAISFRPADKAFMQHYFEQLHHPMEAQGVDFWWLDWQQGEVTDIKGLDPLPWLNHLHSRDSTRRGTRPMLYSRWGGLGNHRYPIGFSGDTYSTWESLRFLAYSTPTASNVAYGWWSHDIGGHFHATQPELYARWVQFGAVSPCLRLHSTKDPLAERRPWAFPEPVFEAARAAFKFRYQLLPYLYSAARTASEQGLSLCTPMYYEFPDAEDAYLAREQYFFGDQMFVAPVVQPSDPVTGLAPVDVWIPPGTWIDYNTLETYSGARWIRLQADLNRIPMFVKAGGIVPLANGLQHTRDLDAAPLTLNFFPGGAGAFELYEDDGVTEAYTRGDYQTTAIRSAWQGDKLTINIDGAQGNLPSAPATRTFELLVRGVEAPSAVSVDGWTYDAAAQTLKITLNGVERRQAQEVTVSASPAALPAPTKSAAPFVRVLDYTTFEDASQQVGALVLVPVASPYDAEIEWEIDQNGTTEKRHISLNHVRDRQIVYAPFADDGTLRTYRWRVSGTLAGVPFASQSAQAYPTINRWRTLIYDRDQQPLSIADVLEADASLPWVDVTQDLKHTLNAKQPYGLILLEGEIERINKEGATLEACVSSTLTSADERSAALHLTSVGTARLYLNGEEILPTDTPAADGHMPMFTSWMPPTHLVYTLPLRAGANSLVIFTRPDSAIGWWGIGAQLLDQPTNGDLA